MKITILTLFPEMFAGPFSESIIKRAQENKLVQIQLIHIRDFGIGLHKMVDDKPYGGGVGMVMKVDVIDRALAYVKDANKNLKMRKTVLLDARGRQFRQSIAKDFSKLDHLILLCGHYEGFDERVRSLVDETIAIGDFIVTGGEIPAMLIADAATRLIPGVLKEDATRHESFSIKPGSQVLAHTSQKISTTTQEPITNTQVLLEYPQYTTPQEYNGEKVPDVLLSGNHKAIEMWRREKSIALTNLHRPDLLNRD